jgi:hypothetical protein
MMIYINLLFLRKIKENLVYTVEIINGKSYVGSSKSLSNRFDIYYSFSFLKRKLSKGISAAKDLGLVVEQ